MRFITLIHLFSGAAVALFLPFSSTDQTRQIVKRSNPIYPLPATLVHDFPDGNWIENIAVRKNGQLLVTDDTFPRIYQVDPFGSHNTTIVHQFTDTASILGIVETSPDIFYVCTANLSAASQATHREAYVVEVDMRSYSPAIPGSAKITRRATIPKAKELDGMVFLGTKSNLLLITDVAEGVVYSVDIDNGDVKIPMNNTLTQGVGLAVNGIKYRDSTLYFTNTVQQALVSVSINDRGEAVGNFTILAQGGFWPDDFAMDLAGDFYVSNYVNGSNGIVFVPRDGGQATQIAGMAGPTGCAFGRTLSDRSVLYVTTSGGDYAYGPGKVTVSGKIFKVEVGRRGN